MGKCDWTMEEAKRWVREHKDFKLPEEEKNMEKEIIGKGVIPYKDLGKADEGEAWDGPGEVAKAEVEDLKLMCTWFDSENPDLKTAYKLPHHKADGHKAVWRGVANAAARLPQTDLPEADVAGCEAHLGKHYKDFGKESPWEKSPDEWKKYCEICKTNIPFLKKENVELMWKLFPELQVWTYLFEDIKQESPADKLEVVIKLGDIEEWKKAFAELKEQIESLKSEKVLGNKERQTVRAAIEALNNVLELDEGGGGEEPKRQSLEIEFEKDGGPDLDHIEKKIDEVVEKALNAEKLKSAISEGIRLGIAKLQGKVL